MRRWLLIVGLMLGCVASPGCAARQQTPVPAQVEPAPRAAQPLDASAAAAYAEREQSAEQQRDFAGGRRGGVGTSTLIVILLVAILVVLIV